MIDTYEAIINGRLEEAITAINNCPVDAEKAFSAVINMKSRTYKLYKQIMLTKIILLRNKITHEQGSNIIDLAVKKNSTYIAKQFLRFGYKTTIPYDELKENMILLIESFGEQTDENKHIDHFFNAGE